MRRSTVFVIVLVALLVGAALPLLAQTTVTEDGLLRLTASKAPEALVVKAIFMATAIEVDTSLEGTVTLMGKGISQSVVTALVQRKEQLAASGGSYHSSPAVPAAEGITVLTASPGIFIQGADGSLTTLQVENTQTKSTSPLKLISTGGFGGVKTQGVISGPKSPVQVSGTKVVVLARIFEGMNVDSYQLVTLNSKKDHREFVTSQVSVFKGFRSGPAPSGNTVKFEKVDGTGNVYKAVLELSAGEYGFLQPGGQRPYTFGVY